MKFIQIICLVVCALGAGGFLVKEGAAYSAKQSRLRDKAAQEFRLKRDKGEGTRWRYTAPPNSKGYVFQYDGVREGDKIISYRNQNEDGTWDGSYIRVQWHGYHGFTFLDGPNQFKNRRKPR